MDKTKIYLDLSNCTEEEIKSLPQILEKAGETLGDQTDLEGDDLSYWTNFHKPDYATYWTCGTSTSTPEKTELTYPEFIKLFEGVEGENNGWIKVTDSLPNRNDVVLVLTDYRKMDVCIFKEKDHWLNDMRPQHSNGSVVAWMPLPELPKF